MSNKINANKQIRKWHNNIEQEYSIGFLKDERCQIKSVVHNEVTKYE